jgi:hypothetical protein
MQDHIRILKKAYAAMVAGMEALERHGEEVPPRAINTLAMLETLRDKKTGETVIEEAEKAAVSLVKNSQEAAGEARGEEISGRGVLPYQGEKPTIH